MMPMEHAAQLTGMSAPKKKKTHRGKRNRDAGDVGHHALKAHAAFKAGDHAKAKGHAFSFIKGLASTKAPDDEVGEMGEMETTAELMPKKAAAKPSGKPSGDRARLAAFLARGKR